MQNFMDEIEIISAKYDITQTEEEKNGMIEKKFINTNYYKYYRFKIINNTNYYPNTTTNENNKIDIDNYKFGIKISGILIGDLKIVNYKELYIEDINYIEDVLEDTKDSITLKLKYNLLNSHLKGENIVIGNINLDENNFTTQNLIIYNNWYTRIYYKGYNTLYNYYKNSRTQQIKYINYNTYDKNKPMVFHGNTKYIFKNKNHLKILKTIFNETLIINTITRHTEEIKNQPDKIYIYITFIETSDNLQINNIILYKTKTYIIKKVNLIEEGDSTIKQIKLNNILDIDVGDNMELSVSYEITNDINETYSDGTDKNIFNIDRTKYTHLHPYIPTTSPSNTEIDIDLYTEFTLYDSYYMNDNIGEGVYNYTLRLSDDDEIILLIIKDSLMNEGIPIIQDYLTNNIFINEMNGFNIPEICYSYNNNNIVYNDTNNIITPVIDNNYDTFTYTYLDLVFKSDNEALNNTYEKNIKSGTPIYGYYNNDKWIDTYNNKHSFYTNYYSITIKGKYMGIGGKIQNKINAEDNILNKSIDGFKVLDVIYDTNNIKNGIKLNLKLDLLPIDIPRNYLGNIKILDNETIKDKYIIGYGGNVYEKKIYKDISINGEKYIYLSIKGLNNILNTNKVSYFTKILLNNSPGNHLYDTFINNEITYENNLLDELNELEIKFVNDEGKLFNFEQTEHSFVIEIIEMTQDFI